VAKVMA